MIKLKPCPLCSGEAVYQPGSRLMVQEIYCTKCYCNVGDDDMTKEQLIALWNTRAEHTCTVKQSNLGMHAEDCFVDFSCGHSAIGLYDEFNYCPRCGAKVVE